MTAAAGHGTAEQPANGSGGEGLVLSSSPPASEGPAECVVHRIVPEALGVVWSTVKPMLRDAVRRSPITSRLETINDLETKVYSEEYQLWIVFLSGEIKAAALTCVAEACRCKVLDVDYLAGEDMNLWLEEFIDKMDEEALESDCRFIRSSGPDSWGKILERFGAKKAYSVFMRDV